MWTWNEANEKEVGPAIAIDAGMGNIVVTG
jgi:hypothetical protein